MSFEARYDVIVAGGGIAGVAAALAAAESGVKTALVEKTAFWGGLATGGMIYIYLPLCDGMGHQVSFGLAERLFHAAVAYGPGGVNNAWREPNPDASPGHSRCRTSFVPAAFVLALDELLERSGVEMWLGTTIVGVVRDHDRVSGIRVFNKGGFGTLSAAVIIDATGDAEIVRNAGGRFSVGENTLAFWGMEIAEDATSSRLGHGHDLSAHLRGIIRGTIEPSSECRALTPRGETEFLLNSRRWLRESCRQSGRDRNYSYPVALPALAQIRRAARIASRCGIAEDNHNMAMPGSIGMAADWCNVGIVQEIPYSAMLPEQVGGVIVAGRALDASGYGWELVRSIPAVAVSGEAAGTAAAMCVKHGFEPNELDVAVLQEVLRRRGGRMTLHEIGLPYRNEAGYREPEWRREGH